MKSRLLTCAAAGLACTFPGLAGAQVSVPLDQITANVRAAGLQPLSRPMLRGAVYYVRAINPARGEMRVAIGARSGRVLSATRIAHKLPARTASEHGPAPQPQPSVIGRGYSEAPPAVLSVESRTMPPGTMPDAPDAKLESAPSPAKPVMVPIAPLE